MSEAERRKNPWLKHIYPESHINNHNYIASEIISFRLEELMSHIFAMSEKNESGSDANAIRTIAANLIVEQALIIQREHSLAGYKSMINNLLSEDPEMQWLRDEFVLAISQGLQRNTIKHNRSKVIWSISSFCAGIVVSSALTLYFLIG